MRILKIIPQSFYTPRGTPLSAYYRARELLARGHQVDILAYGFGENPPNLGARVFRARGPHFRRSVPPGPSGLKIWLDFLLLISLVGRLCRQRYDALYAHEEAALLARLAGAIFRIPYIYDMHSSLPLQITDWNFSRRTWVIALFRWVERVCVRGSCVVVAISPAVARAAVHAWPGAHCVVVTNQFDLKAQAGAADAALVRTRHGVQPDEKLIVYTGSFVALQALDLLLEAVPRVLARVPRAKFLLVGAGADADIAELRARATQLGSPTTSSSSAHGRRRTCRLTLRQRTRSFPRACRASILRASSSPISPPGAPWWRRIHSYTTNFSPRSARFWRGPMPTDSPRG